MSGLVFIGGLCFVGAGAAVILWTLNNYGTGAAWAVVAGVLIAAVVAGSGKPGPGQ